MGLSLLKLSNDAKNNPKASQKSRFVRNTSQPVMKIKIQRSPTFGNDHGQKELVEITEDNQEFISAHPVSNKVICKNESFLISSSIEQTNLK